MTCERRPIFRAAHNGSPKGRFRALRYFGSGLALAFLALPAARAGLSTGSSAPFYTAAGIVNAATQTTEALAPNTIATIYGTNLSWTTYAVAQADLDGGTLPTSLQGVTVYVNGISSNLYYVSPGQINFLTPYELTVSSATIQVARQGVAGPPVTVPFAATSPAFFQWNGNIAVAQHADGSLISFSSPAQPGEVVVLYAGGLGRTSPDLASGKVPIMALSILDKPQLQILLDGAPCSPWNIWYAGVTPGFAGLYQINLTLPNTVGPNPQIQVAIGAQSSPAGVQLPVAVQ